VSAKAKEKEKAVVIAAPSLKKQNRTSGDAKGPGFGKWGGLNRKVLIVPGGRGARRFEVRDDQWWENYRKQLGVK
jgi:hypothetical protein